MIHFIVPRVANRGDSQRYWLPGREDLMFPGHGAGQEAIDRWKELCAADTREWFGRLGKE